MRRLHPLLLVLGSLLTAPLPATADVLVPRSGKPIRGVVVKETADEVVFNPYWSRHPDMVWEVERLRPAQVKRIKVAPHPEVEVFRRLAALDGKGETTDALVELGAYAKKHKLKAHARMCYARALAENAEHPAALKGIGGRSKWQATQKGNVHLVAAFRKTLAAYVREEEPARRREMAAELKKAQLPLKPHELERYRRSFVQPRGLMQDRPLAWLSDRFPGAVYTLFVPADYDPVLPTPLLVGLHGGGPDGKQGDEMVGSGRSAMNFYRQQAAKHGVIVVCPTALHAGWQAKDNEELVRAVIEEMKHLYHVDVDRIYLTGHSMGGFGTWALGPRLAEDLAAISPMAGGGRGNISRLVKTKTPIFIYHSDNDYVRVDSDRQAARSLRETDLDFVYTELPGQGHGFPASIQRDLFEFLLPRRRHDPKYREAWPRSSFVGKVTKLETTYVGDPEAEQKGETEGPEAWLEWLERGGGRAAVAADRLGRAKPEGAVSAVAKLAKSQSLSFDARAWAVRTLGLLGDPSAVKTLRKLVQAEAARDQSRIAVEAARALALLGDAEAGRSFGRALEGWTSFFEGKVVGEELAFSDWQRAVPTLAVLVESWAALPVEAGDPAALDRTVVKRVLAPSLTVDTSERVPQDPSRARVALAKAVAQAYERWKADSELRERLAEAVEGHPKARAAVQGGR